MRRPPQHVFRLIAYLAVVAAMAAGFIRLEMNDRRSCEDRRATREAVRQVYKDTAALGRTLVSDDGDADDPEALAIIDQFEKGRLKEFPPIARGCNE